MKKTVLTTTLLSPKTRPAAVSKPSTESVALLEKVTCSAPFRLKSKYYSFSCVVLVFGFVFAHI